MPTASAHRLAAGKLTRAGRAWLLMSLLVATPLTHSQTLCSSAGRVAPTALLERFINADCDACWQDPATPVARANTLALDWVVPSDRGDEAALSAVASLDALPRLEVLKLGRSRTRDQLETQLVGWPGARLQVARGPVVGAYIGASIELTLPVGTPLDPLIDAPLDVWLVMIETLPAGLEASPVPRNLVRNVLQLRWTKRDALHKSEHILFKELRPMNIPAGAMAERLRVIGWVQDASGRILTAAESICPAADKDD